MLKLKFPKRASISYIVKITYIATYLMHFRTEMVFCGIFCMHLSQEKTCPNWSAGCVNCMTYVLMICHVQALTSTNCYLFTKLQTVLSSYSFSRMKSAINIHLSEGCHHSPMMKGWFVLLFGTDLIKVCRFSFDLCD